MPYIGKTPTVGNFQVCDAISVVNGQAAYTLQVGGVNVAPESANHMLVSLNGILQKPGSSFTISGSTMTFASNLATGDVIDFVQILGNVLDLGQPSDDTVTAAKLNDNIISGQTALTSSPDDTDELLISDAGTIKRIDVSLVGGKNTPAFEAYLGSSQTGVANNSSVKVQFNTEAFDTAGAYDNSSNYRFTVPSGQAGKYFFYAGVQVVAGNGSSDLNEASCQIYKNGSVYRYNQTKFNSNPIMYHQITNQASMDLSVGDYIEIYSHAESVISSSTNSFGGAYKQTYFGGYKIIT